MKSRGWTSSPPSTWEQLSHRWNAVGIQTNIGNLNRDIKAANRMMSVIRSTIQNLRDWISDILEARKELLAEKKPETASPDLINLCGIISICERQNAGIGQDTVSKKVQRKIYSPLSTPPII